MALCEYLRRNSNKFNNLEILAEKFFIKLVEKNQAARTNTWLEYPNIYL